MVRQKDSLCPCESGQIYDKCCRPYLTGMALAPTAEALMRSRYTAYVEEDSDYLRETWHPDRRPATIDAVAGQKWLGLKIKKTEAGGVDDATGVVEFVARFKVEGRGHRLHEVSQFVREEGRWLYLSGEIDPS